MDYLKLAGDIARCHAEQYQGPLVRVPCRDCLGGIVFPEAGRPYGCPTCDARGYVFAREKK
jgi:rubrerythrin